MILEFKLKNYRSYKDEVTFSMEAESSKQKGKNVFDVTFQNGEVTRVLKSSLILGANASGKTNLIRALFDLLYRINTMPGIDKPLSLYRPFAFDLDYLVNSKQPTEYQLTFVGPEKIKYVYETKVLGNVVTHEMLNYYPNNRITNLFTRWPYDPDKVVQTGILGDSIGKKEVSVFSNQLLLSKFGLDEHQEQLALVFKHLSKYTVINAHSRKQLEIIKSEVDEQLYHNVKLRGKVSALLNVVDTKIEGIEISKRDSDTDEEIYGVSDKSEYNVYAMHKMYKGKSEIVAGAKMRFEHESSGSRTLYSLGTKILSTVEEGGVLIVDELDTSLHPFVTRLLVMLFQSEKINKNNAQLIFTTHDTTLLDRDLIRRDQIWLAEKGEDGCSDLYSLQDFEGLREDSPFEKWYMAGKFGAIPNIQSLEKIYEDVTSDS
jgi:AAA15 family ATPase/GTPase